MTMIASEPTRAAAIATELDQARKSGPLQSIVIPPCPDMLVRLQKAMAQEDPDLNEVARIASGDVAMSAALLKAANGPLYAAGQPVQTIGQAMNRLGLKQTANLMTSFLAQRAIRISSPQLARFWERATKRAAAMAFMAGKLPGMSSDVAYTFGLFCHVGIAVMAQSIKGYTGTLVEALARIDRPFVATENANHKTDHAVVGALVARTFCLHPLVVSAIRLHHDLSSLGERTIDSDVHTLLAAGLVAEHLMRRHEGMEPDVDWETFSEAAMKWLEMSQDDLNLWQDELNELLNAV
ncbi:MAG: HDOD domain-containing protein [Acidobacteriota bacterium]